MEHDDTFDEDGAEAARTEAVGRFVVAHPDHAADQWAVDLVLTYKANYLDPDLTHWTKREIEEILLHLLPAKSMLDPGDTDVIVNGLAAYLRFLGAEGVMARGVANRLAEKVEKLEPQFRIAAESPENWSFGKRLWSRAASEGVEIGDEQSMADFIARFNELPYDERGAVLGPALGAPTASPGARSRPVTSDAFADEAREAIGLVRLQRLAEFVGTGRPLTQKGNLKLADGKELIVILETDDEFDSQIGDRVFKTKSTVELATVDLTFRIALGAHFLEVEGTTVKPGPMAHLLDDDPMEAVSRALTSLFYAVGPTQHHFGEHIYGLGWYARDLDRRLPMMIADLATDTISDDIEQLGAEMMDELSEIFDLSVMDDTRRDWAADSVMFSVRRALHRVAELGIVDIDEEVIRPSRYGISDVTGGVVEITPLGMWAMDLAFGLDLGLAQDDDDDLELIDATADDLLARAADMPEGDAGYEIEAWIGIHSDAAGLLVDALPRVGETSRGLGFRALLSIGAGAAPAVARLADHPDLAEYVTVFRVDTLVAQPEEMSCAGDPDRFVRLIHAVIDLWGPAATASWADPASGTDGLLLMLDAAWRIDLPETDEVLAAIGANHPDPTVSKQARKALFKRRSAG